ncbi:MAG: hypothetical protein IJI46_10135 [Erysipelotrichaceae bacterium]|nr:hypothetical protein [Erysipelotrichaceae bacterium]
MKRNYALDNTALMGEVQLPLSGRYGTRIGSKDEIPHGALDLGDGLVRFAMYAPTAQSVQLKVLGETYDLERQDDGNWVKEVKLNKRGFINIDFYVDGNAIINPMALIGYGSSAPINFLELAGEDDFYLLKDVPHGSISEEYYYSTVTNCMRCMEIYLPAEYYENPEKEYPTLYLQNGHGENEKCWIYQGKANFILDNLIAEGKAEPMIIVMNNGMVQIQGEEGRYLNTNLLGEVLIRDCIPYVEKRYRVKKDPSYRAMAGLSMGSYQASFTVLSHPEVFAYDGAFSGFIQNPPVLRRGEETHLKALEDPEKFKKDFKVIFRGCGDEDKIVLPCFAEDEELMAKHHLSPEEYPGHVVKIYKGTHEWNVWRECLRDFAQLLFK